MSGDGLGELIRGQARSAARGAVTVAKAVSAIPNYTDPLRALGESVAAAAQAIKVLRADVADIGAAGRRRAPGKLVLSRAVRVNILNATEVPVTIQFPVTMGPVIEVHQLIARTNHARGLDAATMQIKLHTAPGEGLIHLQPNTSGLVDGGLPPLSLYAVAPGAELDRQTLMSGRRFQAGSSWDLTFGLNTHGGAQAPVVIDLFFALVCQTDTPMGSPA